VSENKATKNKVVILQSNYIPWKGYFDMINEADTFVFYDTAKYTKNDWRNRNKIYPKNGVQWLTIPISGSAVNLKIKEVEITNFSWQKKHAKTLGFGYRSCAYFNQLEEFIDLFLIDQTWSSLSELNIAIIKWISEQLKITTNFVNAADLNVEGDRVERLIEILDTLKATHYLSGPASIGYMLPHMNDFTDLGVDVSFKEYPHYREYKQLGSDFEQSVSILDLIAHMSWDEIPGFIWK
tara:strand:+ start:557 stop:1270 length:714 start_codon:yes stop_codon:yes gene_type:complete